MKYTLNTAQDVEQKAIILDEHLLVLQQVLLFGGKFKTVHLGEGFWSFHIVSQWPQISVHSLSSSYFCVTHSDPDLAGAFISLSSRIPQVLLLYLLLHSQPPSGGEELQL